MSHAHSPRSRSLLESKRSSTLSRAGNCARQSSLALTFALGTFAASACTTGRAGEGPTITPGETGAHADQPEGWGEGDSRDELQLRLRKLVEQQRAMASAAGASPSTCEDICSLATSICGVQEKLCSIADKHPGEEAYQGLCREAKQECREAQDDCIRCVEQHAQTGGAQGASAPGATEPSE